MPATPALIARLNGKLGTKALDLSKDHKPNNKGELRRIKKAGGFVCDDGRVDGNLNLSRSLGDFVYKKDPTLKPIEQKISCEAEVRRRVLTEEDRYLILGCDGIFEKATNQALVQFLAPRLEAQHRPARARGAGLSVLCSAFLDHNVAKNPAKEQGLGCDNMTLMCVDLQGTGVVPGPSAASDASGGASSSGRGLALVRRTIDKASGAPLSPVMCPSKRRRLVLRVAAMDRQMALARARY